MDNPWRSRLLVGVLVATTAGWVWLFAASPALRSSLGLLAAVFAVGLVAVWWRDRSRLGARRLTANVALGAIVHLAAASAIVAGDRLWQLGVVPALFANWHHFAIGVLGLAATFVTWSSARPAADAAPVRARRGEVEPAPGLTPELSQEPDWRGLGASLTHRGDGVRLRHLQVLERVSGVLAAAGSDAERVRAATRVVRQETMRLMAEAEAAEREAEENDVLSQAAALVAWGAQKVPELGELDVSDLVMGKVIADIRATHSRVENVFVDHRKLQPIHPITREPAQRKCDERAAAARAALPLLQANGMRLSEELIASTPALAPFESVTGFQVVELLDGGYVTFEGNGRCAALRQAFPDDEGVAVEVRLYVFDEPEMRAAIDRRVRRVRRWKGVDA